MLEKKVQWNLGKSYGLCSASNVIFRVNDKIKEFISVSYIFLAYICFVSCIIIFLPEENELK